MPHGSISFPQSLLLLNFALIQWENMGLKRWASQALQQRHWEVVLVHLLLWFTQLCLFPCLLVACVAGIGSIFSPWFQGVNVLLVHFLFPLLVGTLISFFPFRIIDVVNRLLCLLMLLWRATNVIRCCIWWMKWKCVKHNELA